MLREMCKAKIHSATVTEADLNYTGSITIDKSSVRGVGHSALRTRAGAEH